MEPLTPTHRDKDVSITPGHVVSPHVVDLKPLGEIEPARRRPDLDFEQKLAVLAHRIISFFMPKMAERDVRFQPKRSMTVTKEAPVQATPVATPKIEARFVAAKKIEEPRPQSMLQAFDPWVRQEQPVPAAPKQVQPQKAVQTLPVAARPSNDAKTKIVTAPARPMTAWPRHLATFAVLAVIVTLPVYGLATYTGLLHDASAVAAQTQDAFTTLASAGQQAASLDSSAKGSFDKAAATFDETRGQLRSVTVALAALAAGKGGTLKDGDAILAAGEAISRAGSDISDAFDALDKNSDQPIPSRVQTLVAALGLALPHLDEAAAKLDSVSPASLPESYRAKFAAARTSLHMADGSIRHFVQAAPSVLKMLGAGSQRRYLVLFQNDHELRPTGGFIGSFALVDIQDGKIVHMEIPPGGPYDMRSGLNQRILAPDPLHLVNTRWEFQDANWFADFPTSAKTLAWFYDKSGGPSVDGVIAINSHLMETLLQTVGPVDLPEYGKTITADNFFAETQKAVEIDYDKTANTPKQFIADLVPKVLQKLLDGGAGKLPSLMTAASDALASKDIQAWFSDDGVQADAASYGWTGELRPVPNADFLAVVDANIAGGKTDGVVSEDVRLESAPDANGDTLDTVTITRTHHGKAGDLFTGVKNIDYVRVFAPSGSELVSASGFEKPGDGYFQKLDDTLQPSTMLAAVEGQTSKGADDTDVTSESGLTAFGNWIQVAPGETRTVTLTYRLPFRLTDLASHPTTAWEKAKNAVGAYATLADWKLIVRRQSGGYDRTFSALVKLPSGWSMQSHVPEALAADGEGISWSGPLDRDLYLGAVLSK